MPQFISFSCHFSRNVIKCHHHQLLVSLLWFQFAFTSGSHCLQKKHIAFPYLLISLWISFDTNVFQTSLPTKKLNRISLMVSNFLLVSCHTEWQRLSFIDNLNFTLCVIPQGQAFISYLLSIASSVLSLLTSISLDSSNHAELRLWLTFLGQ